MLMTPLHFNEWRDDGSESRDETISQLADAAAESAGALSILLKSFAPPNDVEDVWLSGQ